MVSYIFNRFIHFQISLVMRKWIKDSYKKAQSVFQTVHKNAISSPVPSCKCDAFPYRSLYQPKELHRGNSASSPDNLSA